MCQNSPSLLALLGIFYNSDTLISEVNSEEINNYHYQDTIVFLSGDIPENTNKIIFNIKQKFLDAGMRDFWEKQVEEYSPQNYGGSLSKDAILDKLFKDWNNKKAPFTYGYKRIQQR